jgi:hypothetical protein
MYFEEKYPDYLEKFIFMRTLENKDLNVIKRLLPKLYPKEEE